LKYLKNGDDREKLFFEKQDLFKNRLFSKNVGPAFDGASASAPKFSEIAILKSKSSRSRRVLPRGHCGNVAG
jgi:hypothetical protein